MKDKAEMQDAQGSSSVTQDKVTDCIRDLHNSLPVIFTRQVVSKKLGNMISPRTFANLDSRREGPSVRVSIGGRVGYERESFIQWLSERIKFDEQDENQGI